MAGFEPAKPTDTGITLIEVMVSLLLFSIMIGMSSNMISQGLQHPFVINPAEDWVSFIEEVYQAISSLPHDTNPQTIRTDTPPLNRIQLPRDLNRWQVQWSDSGFANRKLAVFTAVNREGRTIRWRIYRSNDD